VRPLPTTPKGDFDAPFSQAKTTAGLWLDRPQHSTQARFEGHAKRAPTMHCSTPLPAQRQPAAATRADRPKSQANYFLGCPNRISSAGVPLQMGHDALLCQVPEGEPGEGKNRTIAEELVPCFATAGEALSKSVHRRSAVRSKAAALSLSPEAPNSDITTYGNRLPNTALGKKTAQVPAAWLCRRWRLVLVSPSTWPAPPVASRNGVATNQISDRSALRPLRALPCEPTYQEAAGPAFESGREIEAETRASGAECVAAGGPR
jgi:hypothetical protein